MLWFAKIFFSSNCPKGLILDLRNLVELTN